MLDFVYGLPFLVLELPRLKLKKPSWVAMPSPMTVFAFILLSYFLVTGGKSAGGGTAAYTHTHTHTRRAVQLTPVRFR